MILIIAFAAILGVLGLILIGVVFGEAAIAALALLLLACIVQYAVPVLVGAAVLAVLFVVIGKARQQP